MMGWIGRGRSLSKIILFVSFTFVGLSNISFAQEDWREEVNSLLEAEKYDEAYAIVSDPALDEDTAAHTMRGVLLGSGLLSSGQDICAAVLNFEKAFIKQKFVQGSLNFLYYGDWAAIASIEGNADALYFSGLRANLSSISDNLLLGYDELLAAKTAYKYFYNASLLGHEEAKNRLLELEAANPNVDFSTYKKKINFKKIICPVRDEAK